MSRDASCWSRTPAGWDMVDRAREVSELLLSAGFQVRMLEDEAADLGVTDVKAVPPDESAAAGCEVVLVLGGDGTFLRAAELARRPGRALLGVNLGRVGFLAETEPEALPDTVRHDRRARATRWRSGSPSTSTSASTARWSPRDWALNEVSVEKTKRERMLEVAARDRRPAADQLRLRRGGVRHADRLDRLRVLLRRPGGLAGRQALLVVPTQRARAVRPAAGDLAGLAVAITVADAGHDGVLGCDGRRTWHVPAGARVDRPARRAAGAHRPYARAAVHRPAGGQVRAAGRAASGPAGSGTSGPSLWTVPAVRTPGSGYASGVLSEIRIRGLGVIEDVTLELGPGLTVVTGETGAGKTMVVTGLHLLFGGRADPAGCGPAPAGRWSRAGCGCRPTRRCWPRAVDAGAELDEDGELLISRAIAVEGRSRAYLGGSAVPAGLLGELAEGVLAVHGQSDQLRLLAAGRAAPRRWTGTRAPVAALLDRHRAAYGRWRPAGRRPGRPHGQARELAREADVLRHGLDEIAAVEPQPGEDGALATEAEQARARRRAAAGRAGRARRRWPATRTTRPRTART